MTRQSWLEEDLSQRGDVVASIKTGDLNTTGLVFDTEAINRSIPRVKVNNLSDQEKAERRAQRYRIYKERRPDFEAGKLSFLESIEKKGTDIIPLGGSKEYISPQRAMEDAYTKKFLDLNVDAQVKIWNTFEQKAAKGDEDAQKKLDLIATAVPAYREIITAELPDERNLITKSTDFLFGGAKRFTAAMALSGLKVGDITLFEGANDKLLESLEKGEISEETYLKMYKEMLGKAGINFDDDDGTMARKIFANAAEMAVDIVSLGTGGKAISKGTQIAGKSLTRKQVAKQMVRDSLKIAKEGAIEGGLQGAIMPFQEDEMPDAQQVLTGAALGTVIGGAAGFALPMAVTGVAKGVGGAKDFIIKNARELHMGEGGFIRVPGGISGDASKEAGEVAKWFDEFANEAIEKYSADLGAEADVSRELAQTATESTKQLRKDILELGGISKSDVEDLNNYRYVKRKGGQSADRIIQELNGRGYDIVDEDDLAEKLLRPKQEAPVKLSPEELKTEAYRRLMTDNTEEAETFRFMMEDAQNYVEEIAEIDIRMQRAAALEDTGPTKVRKGDVHEATGVKKPAGEAQEVAGLKKQIKDQAKGSKAGFAEGRRTAREEVTARYRKRIAEHAQVKNDLVKWINKNVDLDTRGKLLTKVKNAKTSLDLQRAIEYANKVQTKKATKKMRSEIAKVIKTSKAKVKHGTLKGKFTAQIQRALDDAGEMLKMKRTDVNASIDELVDAMADPAKLEKLGLTDYEAKARVMMLDTFGSIEDMTPRQLATALEELKFIQKNGRSARATKDLIRMEKNAKHASDALEVITGGKGLKPEITAAAKDGWVRKLDNWQQGWDTMLDKLSRYDKTSGQLDSKLNQFGNVVHDARTAQNKGMLEHFSGVQNKYAEIMGTTDKRKLRKILHKNTQKELIELPLADGRRVFEDLSPNEAAYMYQKWQDPTLRPRFEAMNWNEDTVNELVYYMGDDLKRWADWQLDEFHPAYYGTVNEVYKDINGVDLPFNSRYSPIHQDGTAIATGAEMVNQTVQDYKAQFGSVPKGATKGRAAQFALPPQDLDQVLIRHIAQMEHYKAFERPLRDIRSVFTNNDVRQAIVQYHGKDALKTLDGFVDNIARDGSLQGQTWKIVDDLRKNFTRATLGVNPGVFLKQLTSVPAFATEMPMGDFVKYTAEFWTNPKAHAELLMRSDMLKARYDLGFTRDMIDAMSKDTVNTLSKNERFLNKTMVTTKLGDRFAILQGGYATYKHHYKKAIQEGLSHVDADAKAMRKFEQVANRTQQAGNIEHLGRFQRGGSLPKLFTMFQTAPNQYYRIASRSIRDLAEGKGSKAQNLKNLWITWSLLPGLFQAMSDGGLDTQGQAKAQVLGPLGGILALGQFIDPGVSVVTGNDTYANQGIPGPITNFVDAYQALDEARKTITADEITSSDVANLVDDLADIIGKFTGAPTVATTRAIEGADSVIRGEGKSGDRTYEVDQNLYEFVRSMIYGKYGTTQGQEFADENFGNRSGSSNNSKRGSTRSSGSRPRNTRR